MNAGEPREQEMQSPRRRRRWVAGVCATVFVLVGALVLLDESRRPGLLYEYVALPSEALRTLSTSEQEERKYVLQQAREVARWDGVRKVGWPTVNPYNSNLGQLQTPEGRFTAVLGPDADTPALVRRLQTLVNDALEANVQLTVRLEGGEMSPVSVSPVAGDVLDEALHTATTVRALDGVQHVALWLGDPKPEERWSFSVPSRLDVTVAATEYAGPLIMEARTEEVYLLVQTGDCGLGLEPPLSPASLTNARRLFEQLCADRRLERTSITVRSTDDQGEPLEKPRTTVQVTTEPADAERVMKDLSLDLRERGVAAEDIFVVGQ